MVRRDEAGHCDQSTDLAVLASRIGEPHEAVRILLAEDNVVNQRVALRILEKAGHSVVLARDGAEAVEKFNGQRFDMVLMDMQMPKMSGIEATAAIGNGGRATKTHDRANGARHERRSAAMPRRGYGRLSCQTDSRIGPGRVNQQI